MKAYIIDRMIKKQKETNEEREVFQYFRVRVQTSEVGVSTFWARSKQTFSNGSIMYKVCNREGDWGYKMEKGAYIDERVLAVSVDAIVYEKPARMSQIYGWLEITKRRME